MIFDYFDQGFKDYYNSFSDNRYTSDPFFTGLLSKAYSNNITDDELGKLDYLSSRWGYGKNGQGFLPPDEYTQENINKFRMGWRTPDLADRLQGIQFDQAQRTAYERPNDRLHWAFQTPLSRTPGSGLFNQTPGLPAYQAPKNYTGPAYYGNWRPPTAPTSTPTTDYNGMFNNGTAQQVYAPGSPFWNNQHLNQTSAPQNTAQPNPYGSHSGMF
jgi:hypothetical protein